MTRPIVIAVIFLSVLWGGSYLCSIYYYSSFIIPLVVTVIVVCLFQVYLFVKALIDQ